ncbi:hypothetical protein ACTD5D_39780 [Nocardia takedensis]|uniref:hypothetical protein n=1 Tax=Nocardia takedensis TaxID=259390 RepID=UPI003F773174
MTEPVLVPGDPVTAVRLFLAPLVTAKYKGTRVAANLSPKWGPAAAPELVVFDDGGPLRYPVETNPQIRVTVWGSGHDVVWSIAGYALGLLLSRRVPGIAKVLPATGLLEARDDHTGGLMCSFTVRTRVRTVPA